MSDKIASLPVPGPGVVGSNKTTQDLTGVLDECMEKENRNANLVVHNLPEQPRESSAERAKNDAFLFKTMIKEEMSLNVSVTTSFRVGKCVSDKARLLIVTLEYPAAKHDIVRLAPQLRHSNKYVNIYVTPDLTRKERELNKKLRDELNNRKRAGEANLAIRGGRIVRLHGEPSNTSTGESLPPAPQEDAMQPVNGAGMRGVTVPPLGVTETILLK